MKILISEFKVCERVARYYVQLQKWHNKNIGDHQEKNNKTIIKWYNNDALAMITLMYRIA